ncbi:MAG: hypothetical protein GWP08_17415 [Nitrospiraceae bacterium]|nr:hypothetical protein [Nitrospiraceae bacterium]
MRRIVAPLILVAFCLMWLAPPPVAAQEMPASRPNLPEGAPIIERAWPGDPLKFTFAILGDRTSGTSAEWPVFDRAIDELNVLRPDFAIMIGDMIEGNADDMNAVTAQWEEFREHATRIEMPLLLLPGNHDISNPPMLAWWKANVGRTYYAFDYKGCHFLVLNNQEHWAEGGNSFGAEQVKFAVDDIKASRDARHTFVFMHVPIWSYGSPEWASIHSALGDRPHTVFAGHWHTLGYTHQDNATYYVVGATKGAQIRPPNPLPELGKFPHYTLVTAEGRAAHVTFIEPGSVWPPDVAPQSLKEAARNLISVTAAIPEGLDGDQAYPRVSVTVDNAMPGPVEVSLGFTGLNAQGWHTVGPSIDSPFTLASGTSTTVTNPFIVPVDRILPVPRLRCEVRYKGHSIARMERNAPLFPDSALRWPSEWYVVGPFEAGSLPSRLPERPRETMPRAFALHGPEQGYAAGATFREDGEVLTWRPLDAQPAFGLGFVNVGKLYGIPFNDLAYASSAVYSPRDQRVYARLRADDYAQAFVNGDAIEGGRLYRTRRDPEWVALPLKEGWNALVVKNLAITGGWSFRLLLADPGGELRFAREIAE